MSILLSSLQNLGCDIDESRVYILLHERGTQKASEISRQLGLPRVGTYRILSSLESKGIVRASITRPMQFSAVPFGQFIESMKAEASAKLHVADSLGSVLLSYSRQAKLTNDSSRWLPLRIQIINRTEDLRRRVENILTFPHRVVRAIDPSLIITTHKRFAAQNIRIIGKGDDISSLSQPEQARNSSWNSLFEHETQVTIKYAQALPRSVIVVGDESELVVANDDLTRGIFALEESVLIPFVHYFDLLWNSSRYGECRI